MRRPIAAGAICPLLSLAAGGGESEGRIARERAEAAKIARQEERLKQLEHELKRRPSSPAASSAPSQPTPPPASRPTPSSGGSVGTWPAGVDAYTVVLASEATAQRAANASEPAGVLRSDDYSSLRPGYWVAYVGQSSTADEAGREAARLRGVGYSSAYPRLVSDG